MLTNGSPLLKAWASAIGVVGIPGAIAVFLVYVGATEIPKLARGVEQSLVEARQTRELMEEQLEISKTLLQVTRWTCASAASLAKTPEAQQMTRDKCYDR